MALSNSFNAIVEDKSINVQLSDNRITLDPSGLDISIENTGPETYSVILDQSSFDAHIAQDSEKKYKVTINGRTYDVVLEDKRDILLQELGLSGTEQKRELDISSPMPGLVLDVLVNVGDPVEEGTGLVILEAMKMENEIKSSARGIIKAIHVKAGDAIMKNDLLIEIG